MFLSVSVQLPLSTCLLYVMDPPRLFACWTSSFQALEVRSHRIPSHSAGVISMAVKKSPKVSVLLYFAPGTCPAYLSVPSWSTTKSLSSRCSLKSSPEYNTSKSTIHCRITLYPVKQKLQVALKHVHCAILISSTSCCSKIAGQLKKVKVWSRQEGVQQSLLWTAGFASKRLESRCTLQCWLLSYYF